MLLQDIEELISRIHRTTNLLNKKYGDGIQLEVITPESDKIFYEIKNVKSLSVYKDQILNLAIWVWSFKDYIKEILGNIGRDQSIMDLWIQTKMNRNLRCISLQ